MRGASHTLIKGSKGTEKGNAGSSATPTDPPASGAFSLTDVDAAFDVAKAAKAAEAAKAAKANAALATRMLSRGKDNSRAAAAVVMVEKVSAASTSKTPLLDEWRLLKASIIARQTSFLKISTSSPAATIVDDTNPGRKSAVAGTHDPALAVGQPPKVLGAACLAV